LGIQVYMTTIILRRGGIFYSGFHSCSFLNAIVEELLLQSGHI